MIVAKLVNYFDVWGNKKDGYEVNNLCSEGEIELQDTSVSGILVALKEKGFFKKHVRSNMVDVENMGEMIEIYQRSNHMPVCRLEIEY